MATQSIEDVLSMIKNKDLESELSTQLTNYNIFSKECEMLAKAEKIDIKDNNWFDKAKLWTSIKMKTAFNKSTTNFAEMFILGTVMGLIDITKETNANKDTSTEINELALKLEDFQENCYQKLKQYL